MQANKSLELKKFLRKEEFCSQLKAVQFDSRTTTSFGSAVAHLDKLPVQVLSPCALQSKDNSFIVQGILEVGRVVNIIF